MDNLTYQSVAGIDIAKKHLDVAYWPGKIRHKQYQYTKRNCLELAKKFIKEEIEVVIIEASGGYEQQVLEVLLAAGIRVALIQAQRGRQFMSGLGQLSKNDKIDARLLAEFGGTIHKEKLRLATPKSEAEKKVSAYRKRRNQLVNMRKSELNRLDKISDKEILRDVKRNIARLTKEIKSYEQKALSVIKADEEKYEMLQLLLSVHGIGLVTAVTLISELPELGKTNRQRIASLAGLACYAKDSGGKQSRRSIFGGRSEIRCKLYMCILSVTRGKGILRGYYERLLKEGKDTKVAQVACMRKLLVYLNTLMKDFYASQAGATPC